MREKIGPLPPAADMTEEEERGMKIIIKCTAEELQDLCKKIESCREQDSTIRLIDQLISDLRAVKRSGDISKEV